VAEPGVRPGAAVGDPTPAEVDGPGEVRRPAVAAVQGQGPGVPGGPGAKAGEPKPVMVKPRRRPPKYDPPPTHPWRHMIFGNGPQG